MTIKYNINKLPILIISSPRTGSTILAHDIKESLHIQNINLEVYNEPLFSHEREMFLKSFYEKKENYILKTHAHDFLENYKFILDSVKNNFYYLIRIRRKNIIEQIASNHIAGIKNGWGYYSKYTDKEKYNLLKEESVELNIRQIKNNIKYIQDCNLATDNLDLNYNLDLFYEDIDLTSNHMLVSPKPKNYEILKKIIEKEIHEC